MQPLDWSHLQSFVTVAENGSLSAAARVTGNSQPTLSRHISALETSLGARLFDRSKSGVTLTEKGSALMQQATRMADAAAQMSLIAESATDDISGTVRITASQIVATYLLPDVLTELHLKHPKIEVELVASDDTNNLLRREADIALRMYRPTQPDMIAKNIGTLELGAYASAAYIARRGMPDLGADILEHDFIGYDHSTLIIDGMAAMGMDVDRAFFKFRSDDQVVCWEMVRAGFGIGFNQRSIAARDPSVVCVSGGQNIGTLPVWLTAHPEVRQTPRIRKVYDHLAQSFGAFLSAP